MSNERSSKNVKFIAWSDMDGRRDAVSLMAYGKYLYVGHLWSGGVSILDISDPKHPKTVNHIPCPNNTWSSNIQVADDLLLVADELKLFGGEPNQPFSSGLRIFDVSNPLKPRELSFTPSAGWGPHRMWYAGGKYAHVPFEPEGFTWPIYVVFDVSDPEKPEEVSRWWLPGMWEAGGEKPTDAFKQPYSLYHYKDNPPPIFKRPDLRKPFTKDMFQGEWYWLHGAIVHGDRAYCGWWDAGMIILDISDITNPRFVSQLDFSAVAGKIHTALPLPDRDLIILAEECMVDNCEDQQRMIWIVDNRVETAPTQVASFPIPEGDFCQPGSRFGPHNVHENRPGSFISDTIIFDAYFNAGLRVFDISNQYAPKEVGHFLPANPEVLMDPRPGKARLPSSQDVFVNKDGIAYMTDYNCGLYVLEFTG